MRRESLGVLLVPERMVSRGLAGLLLWPRFGSPLFGQGAPKQCLDDSLPADIEPAGSSSSRSMPCVRSTFTRRTGLTTVNLLVKYAETSSPRDAISAISSAVRFVLDIFGIALLQSNGKSSKSERPNEESRSSSLFPQHEWSMFSLRTTLLSVCIAYTIE
jgi:hypothetical protein